MSADATMYAAAMTRPEAVAQFLAEAHAREIPVGWVETTEARTQRAVAIGPDAGGTPSEVVRWEISAEAKLPYEIGAKHWKTIRASGATLRQALFNALAQIG